MIEDFISLFQTDFYVEIWQTIFATWPVWLQSLLVSLLAKTWFSYKRREWIKDKVSRQYSFGN